MTARDFAELRAELGLLTVERLDHFDAEVVKAAEAVAALTIEADIDLTAVPFVTIDPPGAKDLDQAIYLERAGDGFVVRYAIADLGAVIKVGDPIDIAARKRGQTIYLPDGRIPLHPPILSEDALSLLPDQVRRAAVWTIKVDAAGAIGEVAVQRAVIRSVARLDYLQVQQAVETGQPHPSIEALKDLGELRRRARLANGAIELAMPEQQVQPSDNNGSGWTIRFEPRTEADSWNAEVSLLTGMAAAQLMLDAKVGIIRYLPWPSKDTVNDFLSEARALGIDVDSDITPGELLASLDMTQPASLGLTAQATRLLRGAGYAAFDGTDPEHTEHSGIGGPYAHVTAPLRRLADRFTTEVCLALSAGNTVSNEIRGALADVAEQMSASDRQANQADRGAVDQAEVWVMQEHLDTPLEAIVMFESQPDRPAEVMVTEPAVLSHCEGSNLTIGAKLTVAVKHIDDKQRRVVYQRVE